MKRSYFVRTKLYVSKMKHVDVLFLWSNSYNERHKRIRKLGTQKKFKRIQQARMKMSLPVYWLRSLYFICAMRFQSKIIGLQTEYQVKWNLFLFLCSFIDLNFRIASKVFRFIFDEVSVKWCAQNQFKTILRRCFNSKRKTGFFVVAVECKSNECEIVNECVCKSCRVSKYLCFVTRTKESHHSRFSQFSQLCIQNTHSPIPGSYNWAHIAY